MGFCSDLIQCSSVPYFETELDTQKMFFKVWTNYMEQSPFLKS